MSVDIIKLQADASVNEYIRENHFVSEHGKVDCRSERQVRWVYADSDLVKICGRKRNPPVGDRPYSMRDSVDSVSAKGIAA